MFIASTGIISSHQLMDRLYTISCDNHHDYLFKSIFIKAIKKLDGYSIELKKLLWRKRNRDIRLGN